MWGNAGIVVILGLGTGWGDFTSMPQFLGPKKEEAQVITGV
jgi:hypothetical protein